MKNILIGKRNKFLTNTVWIIGEKVLEMVIQLLVGLVSIRYLGTEGYGSISYIASFIALFNSICTLGLEGVVVKKIIDEPESVGEIVGTSIYMRIFSSIFSVVSILGIVYFVNNGDNTLLLLALLQSIGLIFASFGVIDFWFQSSLDSKYVSITKGIAALTVALWKIYLLIFRKDIIYFAFSSTLQSIVVCVLLVILYKRNDGPKLSASLKRAKSLIKESYHFILSGLVVVIYTQMDKIMIGQMLNNSEVGVYTAASNIPGMYAFIFAAVINSAQPLIFEAKNKNGVYLDKLKKLYCFIIWVSIIIAVLVTVNSKTIIYLLYGKEYVVGAQVLNLSVWGNLFALLGSARGIWVVAENKNKYVKKYLFWGAVVNLTLNMILIPVQGIEGAAFATLVTQVTTCLIAPLFYKETRIHTRYILEAALFR